MIKLIKQYSAVIFAGCLCFFNSPKIKAMDAEDVVAERVVHYFSAPQLDEENRGVERCCVRPVCKDSLDLAIEEIGDKLVITNSGYGGSGISIGEGGVDQQIEQFIKRNIDRDTKITVLGGGWIGSLTALKLQALGYKNLEIIADSFSQTTSFNAGGLIMANSQQFSAEFQVITRQFEINSHNSFLRALEGTHPFIKCENDSVRKIPFYKWTKHKGLDACMEASGLRPAIDVTLKILDTEVSHNMVCYPDSLFVNTSSVLQQFRDQLGAFQIPMIEQHITNFSQIRSPIIFNCSGLRSAGFPERNDHQTTYVPTLGHLIMGMNQDTSKERGVHNSMIVSSGEEFKTVDDLTGYQYYNSFPKHYTQGSNSYQFVTGGTAIPGVTVNDWGVLNPKHDYLGMFDRVWDNARKFYGFSTNTM